MTSPNAIKRTRGIASPHNYTTQFPEQWVLHWLQTAVRLKCHVLEILRDTQSPSFITQHLLCRQWCSVFAGADNCTCASAHLQRLTNLIYSSSHAVALHGHNCKLISLCLKLCKLNFICQMAFSPCRSPVALSTLILTLTVCLDRGV